MEGGLFQPGHPLVVAALHLPAFPASRHPDARPLGEIIEQALRNTERAVRAGVASLYIQDLGDAPHALRPQPYTVAGMSVVGSRVHTEFPELALGVCLMSHGAEETLAVAQAIGARFVRLKVYVGAMVKAEGILQGCAYEAVRYRSESDAEEISIFADIYDRTGEPLGRAPLAEEARQAATFGRADGLVLTGRSVDETRQMLGDVRAANLGVPLLAGGGVTAENLAQFLPLVDGIIVSTAFKPAGGWTRQGITEEWDESRIRLFIERIREGRDQEPHSWAPGEAG